MLLGSSAAQYSRQGLAVPHRDATGCQQCCHPCMWLRMGTHDALHRMRMPQHPAATSGNAGGAWSEETPKQQQAHERRTRSYRSSLLNDSSPRAQDGSPATPSPDPPPRAVPATRRRPGSTQSTSSSSGRSRGGSTASPRTSQPPRSSQAQAQAQAGSVQGPVQVLPPVAEAEDAVAAQEEGVPLHLRKAYPWLFNKTSARTSPLEERIAYAQLLERALPVLATYDIASLTGRAPSLDRPPQLIEPSLTARVAARAEAAARMPRPVSVPLAQYGSSSVLPEVLQQYMGESGGAAVQQGGQLNPALVAAQDGKWAAKLKTQEAYLAYMQELASVLVPAAAQQGGQAPGQTAQPGNGGAQQVPTYDLDAQLSYQAGLCDDWLQLSHLLTVFDRHMGPAACAALYMRLPALVSARTARGFSPSERHAFGAFAMRLAQRTLNSVGALMPAQVGHVAYGLAIAEQLLGGTPLFAADQSVADDAEAIAASNVESAAVSSTRAARQAAARSLLQALCSHAHGMMGAHARRGAGRAAASWQPADLTQLVWAMGMLGSSWATPALLQAICAATLPQLARLSAAQLWGLLWGLARAGHMPPARWMELHLQACERVMSDFDAEGLGHLIWSLASLGQKPERLWMRAFVGAAFAKLRSLQAAQMLQIMEGLAVIGYAPRQEVGRGLLNQTRRLLHTMSGPQQAQVLRALASHEKWRPPVQLLYDFVASSEPKLNSLSPSQAASVLWCFARFGYLPEQPYTIALVSRVSDSQFTQSDGDALTMTLWSLVTLKAAPLILTLPYTPIRQPSVTALQSPAQPAATAAATKLPGAWPGAPRGSRGVAQLHLEEPEALASDEGSMLRFLAADITLGPTSPTGPGVRGAWLRGWVERLSQLTDTLSAPGVANALWSMAELGVRPPPVLLDALLLRSAEVADRSTPKELSDTVSALARMSYRPSDTWLRLFTRQVEPRLPLSEGDDFGLMLWGLGSLGAPLERFWLQALCREAGRKWHSHSGEGLGLLVWGLAQYGYSPYTTVPTRSPADMGRGRFAARQAARAAAVAQGAQSSTDEEEEEEEEEEGEAVDAVGGEGVVPHVKRVQGASGTLLPRLRMRRRESAWWAGLYREAGDKWESASPRALVLMLLGVAELIGTAPDREWQRRLIKALRLRIPRPPTSTAILPTLLDVGGLLPPGWGEEAAAIELPPATYPSATVPHAPPSTKSASVRVSPGVQGSEEGEEWGGEGGEVQSQGGAAPTAVPGTQSAAAAALSAALPPNARNSVWLAAFLAELSTVWGFPRAAATPRRWLQRLGGEVL